jgi:hypothetical protein
MALKEKKTQSVGEDHLHSIILKRSLLTQMKNIPPWMRTAARSYRRAAAIPTTLDAPCLRRRPPRRLPSPPTSRTPGSAPALPPRPPRRRPRPATRAITSGSDHAMASSQRTYGDAKNANKLQNQRNTYTSKRQITAVRREETKRDLTYTSKRICGQGHEQGLQDMSCTLEDHVHTCRWTGVK